MNLNHRARGESHLQILGTSRGMRVVEQIEEKLLLGSPPITEATGLFQ